MDRHLKAFHELLALDSDKEFVLLAFGVVLVWERQRLQDHERNEITAARNKHSRVLLVADGVNKESGYLSMLTGLLPEVESF
ncbi:hypothetical protein DY000_02057478 [Brassica cretica]|uniref:Uncharacterized protein n=1 Tax=Brassica cretica TaxID=69181 RepID=A0ABQ7AL29_BRACR|nr:hypothetical protein DY000_02057478 [Brassica cretica]